MARGARGVEEGAKGKTTPCIYVIAICAEGIIEVE
jgi:hypothetical protein